MLDAISCTVSRLSSIELSSRSMLFWDQKLQYNREFAREIFRGEHLSRESGLVPRG